MVEVNFRQLMDEINTLDKQRQISESENNDKKDVQLGKIKRKHYSK